MDPMIGWILVILGLAALIVYAKTKVSVGHPAVVPVVAVALIVAPFAMGWVAVPSQEPAPTGTTIDYGSTICPSFDVTAAAGGLNANANYNDDTRTFNIPVTINSTTNVLSATTAALNFSYEPVPTTGSTTDDLAVIYFESDYRMQFEGENILSTTNNIFDAEWTDESGSTDYKGSDSMQMTGNGWANITWTLDSGNSTWAEEAGTDDVYDTVATWNVRLYNGCSWSETYTVNLIVTSVTA